MSRIFNPSIESDGKRQARAHALSAGPVAETDANTCSHCGIFTGHPGMEDHQETCPEAPR